ncbi:CidA/LrgA family protein [Paenibacillus turicensis]|uniref:CidA/LrgA family protein n=1 Tax=Paenibacillus turicensis TaxID=160487 RepID=UPI003D2D7D9D
MKWIKVILQSTIFYAFYWVGDAIQHSLHLPVSGSILGLLLLFVSLLTGVIRPQWIESGTGFFQKYMPIFFIPSTVGIMNYLDLFTGKGLMLIPIVVVSSMITLAFAAASSYFVVRRREKLEGKAGSKKVLSEGEVM